MVAMSALRAFYYNRTRTMASEELSQLVKTGQPANYPPGEKCLRDTLFEHMLCFYKSPIDLDQVLVQQAFTNSLDLHDGTLTISVDDLIFI